MTKEERKKEERIAGIACPVALVQTLNETPSLAHCGVLFFFSQAFVKHTTAISDGLTETLTASFRLKNLLLLLLPRAVSDLPPASSTASHPTAPPPQSIGPLASLFLILSSLTTTPLFSSVPPTDLIFSVSSWRARLK